jgi:hypothetical protein
MATDIGQQIFRTGAADSSKTPVQIMEKFLVIYTFDNVSTTPSVNDIDGYIFSPKGNQALVFSPKGHLYFTTVDSNGNLINPPTSIFPNPINPYESYSANFTNWEKIDYTKFSLYNSSLAFPQYFASLSGNLGNNAVGSGYLLYRNTVWSGKTNDTTAKYYLLYNPFNRAQSDGNILINSQPLFFSNYANQIQFQDESCYCTDDKNHRCLYALAGAQSAGDTILNIDVTKIAPDSLQSIAGLKANCGCNKICQGWLGKNLLKNRPNCTSTTTNVICGVNISASDKSTLDLAGGVKTTQNCSTNSNNSNSSNNSNNQIPPSQAPNIILPLSIAVVVIILAIAGGVFFLRK